MQKPQIVQCFCFESTGGQNNENVNNVCLQNKVASPDPSAWPRFVSN